MSVDIDNIRVLIGPDHEPTGFLIALSDGTYQIVDRDVIDEIMILSRDTTNLQGIKPSNVLTCFKDSN
jgi:hypothetical protein